MVDQSEAGWSVRDLAELAGTTVRTIHYYISEGLVPPPAGATRSASYSPAHLARLRLIGALRDEGLALASIRQRLAPLTDAQALEVAGELDAHLSQAGETPLTTLGLIEAALASQNAAESETRESLPSLMHTSYSLAEPVQAFSAQLDRPEPDEPRGTAGDYLERVRRKPVPPRPVQPAPMPRPKPPGRKPLDSDRPEAWYHVRIEDGIELRVREDRYRESKGRLRAVVDTLRTTLRRYGLSQADNSEE